MYKAIQNNWVNDLSTKCSDNKQNNINNFETENYIVYFI